MILLVTYMSPRELDWDEVTLCLDEGHDESGEEFSLDEGLFDDGLEEAHVESLLGGLFEDEPGDFLERVAIGECTLSTSWLVLVICMRWSSRL